MENSCPRLRTQSNRHDGATAKANQKRHALSPLGRATLAHWCVRPAEVLVVGAFAAPCTRSRAAGGLCLDAERWSPICIRCKESEVDVALMTAVTDASQSS